MVLREGVAPSLTAFSAVPLLLGYRRKSWREGIAPSPDGFGDRGFFFKLPPHQIWSGQRDLHSYPGVGNAELCCLSYDRKAKKNKHLSDSLWPQVFAGGLSELQESCILKTKSPTLFIE